MNIYTETLISFIGSFCFGIIFNIKGKKLFFAGLGGALSQLAYSLSVFFLVNEISRYFFATIITAVFAEAMARVLKAPATVFLVPSIIPLVPGGMLYETMELCIQGHIDEFQLKLFNTIGVAGSLAMGILFVSSFSRLFKVAELKIKKASSRKSKKSKKSKIS